MSSSDPESLVLTLLGTGCPIVDPNRLGPSALVRAGGQNLLVDCGSGVTQRLVQAGCPGRDIDALLLTHLHSDHVIDLMQLVISSWHQGRQRPLKIYGPAGTRKFTTALLGAWRDELDQRIEFECRTSVEGLELDVEEVEQGEIFSIGGLAVNAIEVDHRPVVPAFGFGFRFNGRHLVLSGDTTYCPGLIEHAQGCDVLVHEVFIHSQIRPSGGTRSSRTMENVASYHTLDDVVGRVAAEAGAGTLVLTHFVPPAFDEAALEETVRRSWDGRLRIGHDLCTVDVGGSETPGKDQ